MMAFLRDALIFFISALAVGALSFLRIPNQSFQQITAALLALMFILLSRIIFPNIQLIKSLPYRSLLLFLSSSFVQLLIISTGGFYSPFLIFIHLYTLGVSFFLNNRSSILFMLFAVLALGANTFYSSVTLTLLKNDPGPVILYLISFVVIVPIVYFLIHSYQFKDRLFEAIKEYAQVGEQREESILKSLQEIIIVTSSHLSILSANTTAEKVLHVTQAELLHQPLFNVIPIIDVGGNPIKPSSLSLDQLFTDKAARIIKGFFLQPKGDTKKKPVVIQVRGIYDSQKQINQLVFVITDEALQNDLQRHTDIEQAQQHYQALLNELKKVLTINRQNDSLLKTNLVEKIAEDIRLAFELEDHGLKENPNLEDIAYIGKQAMKKQYELAQALGVKLEFLILPENATERAVLDLKESTVLPALLPTSTFSVIVDKKWTQILVEKLLEIGLFLAAEKSGSVITITPHILSTGEKGALDITFPYPALSPREQTDLFQRYYGNLGTKSYLKAGSGLEGFIAKSVAERLGINLTVDSNRFSSKLTFRLEFNFQPPN